MALQGTIETFPLADVLTLLGSSSKTGKLLLNGDRGAGCLWVDDGAVIGGSVADHDIDDAARLVFELMRFSDGAFEFASAAVGDTPPVELDPAPLAEAIVAAVELLEQWRAIEMVVPTMTHRVLLAPQLPEDTVTIDASTWALIVAAGRTPAVDAIARELDLDEFAVCAAIASLVEVGLAEIDEPAASSAGQLAVVTPAGVDDASAEAQDDGDTYEAESALDPFGSSDGEEDSLSVESEQDEFAGSFPDRFPIDDLLGDGAMEAEDPWSSPEMEQLEAQRRADSGAFDAIEFGALPPIESVPFGQDNEAEEPAEPQSETARSTAAAWNEMVEPDDRSDPGATRPEDDTADEVLRQMSKLSPKAAEAIAAALSTVPAGPVGRSGDGEEDGGSEAPSSFLGSF